MLAMVGWLGVPVETAAPPGADWGGPGPAGTTWDYDTASYMHILVGTENQVPPGSDTTVAAPMVGLGGRIGGLSESEELLLGPPD